MEGGAGDILALSELLTGYQKALDEEENDAALQRRVPALTPSTIGGAGRAPEGKKRVVVYRTGRRNLLTSHDEFSLSSGPADRADQDCGPEGDLEPGRHPERR